MSEGPVEKYCDGCDYFDRIVGWCEEIVLEIFRQLEDAPTCFFCGEADGHKPGCIGAGIEGMVK